MANQDDAEFTPNIDRLGFVTVHIQGINSSQQHDGHEKLLVDANEYYASTERRINAVYRAWRKAKGLT